MAFPLRERTDLSEKEIQDIVCEFLAAVQIDHARELFPDEISGGMQKRLGIARALALNPEIIFYDDPTAGLDPITSRIIIDLIIKLKRQNNSTLVAVTNDMNRAHQLADRLAVVIETEVLNTGNWSATVDYNDDRVNQFISGRTQGPLTGGSTL